MKTSIETNPIMIFAGTNWEAKVVKSLLDKAEIEAFVKDEKAGLTEHWVAAAGGTGAKVFVSGSDFINAHEIVNEFKKKKNENGE